MKILFLICSLLGYASAQTADKAFWTVTAANASMTALDDYTTARYVGTRNCPWEQTNPGLYGEFPKAPRVTLIMGGIFAGSVGLSYVLKRHRVHLWKCPLWAAPQGYMAYGHAWGGIHNLRHCL